MTFTAVFNPSDPLFVSEPFTVVVSSMFLPGVCSYCIKHNGAETVFRCGGCRVLHYCDRACQQNDWAEHCRECRYLKRYKELYDDIPSEEVRLWSRVLIKRATERLSNISEEKVLGRRITVDDLPLITDSTNNAIETVRVNKLFKDIEKFIGSTNLVKRADIMYLLKRRGCQEMWYQLPAFPVALGFFLAPSLLPHSCDPAVQLSFTGRKCEVRALKTVEYSITESFAPLTIARTSLLQAKSERLNDIYRQYGGWCHCDRCDGDIEDPIQESNTVTLAKIRRMYNEARALYPTDKFVQQMTLYLRRFVHLLDTDLKNAPEMCSARVIALLIAAQLSLIVKDDQKAREFCASLKPAVLAAYGAQSRVFHNLQLQLGALIRSNA